VVITSRLPIFLGAALAPAITPGRGIFYVPARSLRGGRRQGVLSAVAAAAFGLSAIRAASAIAFETVRFAGAACLIYLGYRMIRGRNEEMNDNNWKRAPVAAAPSRGA
jgi:threonine/homoserine/homoserine lactone efflux protein